MILMRCTVIDARRPERVADLELQAPDGATFGQAEQPLLEAVGAIPGCELTVNGRAVASHTLLGTPPLVDGALLVAVREPAGLPCASPGVLELHVVGGPDSGSIIPVRPGRHVVGRSPSADVTVADSDLSRQHLALDVGAGGMSVADLGSVNGTSVDGVPVTSAARPLRPHQRIQAGSTALAVRSPDFRPADARPNGSGQIELNCSPHQQPPSPSRTVDLPEQPVIPAPYRVPWIGIALPLAISLPIAWLMKQPLYLLFGLMGPAMAAGSALADRFGRRRQARSEHDRWQREDSAARDELDRCLAAELTARRDSAGDPAALLAAVRVTSTRVWQRPAGDGVLDLHLGTGRQPAAVRLRGRGEGSTCWLDDAPVQVSLADVGHLGISGPPAGVNALSRYLLAQIAGYASPRVARVTVVSDHPSMAWSRWLPHAMPLSLTALAGWVGARSAGPPIAASRPRVVVLIDEARRHAGDPALRAVLADGPAAGVHAICLASDIAALPNQCRATLEVRPSGLSRLTTPAGEVTELTANGVSEAWAEQVARALAPLRDVAPDPGRAAIADDVGLFELLDLDPGDVAGLAGRWRGRCRTTSAVIGVHADGPLTLDLVDDGPHVLIGGTTGSGKSELLQTLVVSLAAGNRPDELCFVLVDYKGGAAFSVISGLPHVVGLVTDLDEHLAERALTSLQAELTRRERALLAAGCQDLSAYQRWRDAGPARPRLPRLVLVIDEFRLLATEQPAFLEGLVRLAAIGRSLGVHLVLATQRPGGIITADIRTNVNARIALRVRDQVDSDDVIEAPDAARLPQNRPGAALARIGSGPLLGFQVARAGGVRAAAPPDGVVVAAVGSLPPPRATPSSTDLTAFAWSARDASQAIDAAPAARPWLAPLPDLLELGALRQPGADAGVAVGRRDLPSEQRQPALLWHPRRDGHVAISGGARSGRTSALLSFAAALTTTYSPHEVTLHVIDAAGGRLAALDRLPHSGTVLTRDQPRLVDRLITGLLTEMRRRHREGVDGPSIVLLVDGWDALTQLLEGVDHGRPIDDLVALLRDGESAGVRAVVAGGRAVLLSRLAGVVSTRLLLKTPDPTDLLLAGVPSSAALRHQPPGRAVMMPGGVEVQLAWAGDAEAVVAGALERDSASVDPGALRLRELPRLIDAATLGSVQRSSSQVLIGLGGDDASPVWLDLVTEALVAVTGPAGSGRSSALVTVATALHGGGAALAAICPRRSPLDAGPWPVLAAEDLDALAGLLRRSPDACLLVDDAELLRDTATEVFLVDVARSRGPASVVVASELGALPTYRGLGRAIQQAGTGVVLNPASGSDGELLGVRADVPDVTVPGRGVLVVRGAVTPVQVVFNDRSGTDTPAFLASSGH